MHPPRSRSGMAHMGALTSMVAVASAAIFAAVGASVAWREAAGLDIALHAVAWGSTAALAWRYLLPGALRTALLTFGFGVVAWGGFVLEPGWAWWLAYQATRVLAAGWFTVAVWHSIRGRDDAVA